MITGIDMSLTSTGVAFWGDGDLTVTTTLVTSSGKTKDTLRQRYDRQTSIVNRVLELVRGSELVVIENLFTAKNAGALIDRAGAWWRINGWLLEWGIPVLVVPGTQSKLFLTGKGNADKGTMVRYAGKLWPDWEPSSVGSSEDEADAIALLSIGAALLKIEPFEMTDYRQTVLGKLAPQAMEIGV